MIERSTDIRAAMKSRQRGFMLNPFRFGGGGGGGSSLQYVGGTSGSSPAGSGSSYNIILSGTLTGGIASSPAVGDYILVATSHAAGSSTSALDSMTVGGNLTGAYVLLHTGLSASDLYFVWLKAFARRITGSVDTAVSIGRPGTSTRPSATVIHVWRGVDATTQMDVPLTSSATANESRFDPASITPITPGAVILVFGAGSMTTSGSAFSGISGMSNTVSRLGDGSGLDVAILGASYAWVSGAYNPAQVSGGYSDADQAACAYTIALRPA